MEQTTQGEHDRAQLIELFQGLFLLALEKGARIASIGTSSASISLSDNGRGWTLRAFETRFPTWDLGRRLRELGCVEVQIISKSRRAGLTTGRLRPDQLHGCPVKQAESPSPGTAISFTLTQPVHNLQEVLQVARGTIPMQVRLNLQDIPPPHQSDHVWFTVRTTAPPGLFALSDVLPGAHRIDRRGLCQRLPMVFPRSVFVPHRGVEVTYEEGLAAACRALQRHVKPQLHRKPILEPKAMMDIAGRLLARGQSPAPLRLAELAFLLGYATLIKTEWKVTREGVRPDGVQLSGFNREAHAVEGLSRTTASALGSAGLPLTTSELAPPSCRHVRLRLQSLDHLPAICDTLNDYASSETSVKVVPCKTVKAGRLRLPWVLITPEDLLFEADGEALGDPPWSFLAIDASDQQQLRRVLWKDTQVLYTFAWLMTQWDHESLDWCLYGSSGGGWHLNLHRVRLPLMESVHKVARWPSVDEGFLQEARRLEEQLDPALTRLAASAASFDEGLRGPLAAVTPHPARLEASREALWTAS